MDFKRLTKRDNPGTGAVEISLVADADAVREQLAEFYEVVAPHHGFAFDDPWDEVDAAAEANMGAIAYREVRRDFVVNRLVFEALVRLDVTPALTPKIHVLDYPEVERDFAIELSVMQRPHFTLSSYEPVEVEPYEEHVTEGMVDARIEELLRAHAQDGETLQLTDAWVDAHIENASTVDELRQAAREILEAEMTLVNRDTLARLANIELEKRLEGKIPDEFFEASRAGLMDKLKRDLAMRGQTLEGYLESEQKNEEELSVEMLIRSAENLRQGFALETLFDGRGMQFAEGDMRFACEQAFGKGTYDEAALRQSGRYRLVESAAKRMRALNWLTDTATVRG